MQKTVIARKKNSYQVTLRTKFLGVTERCVVATKKMLHPKTRLMLTKYVQSCTEKEYKNNLFLLYISICYIDLKSFVSQEKYFDVAQKLKGNVRIFWVFLNKQDSEYACGTKKARIWNLTKLWIWKGFQYANVSQRSKYARIFLAWESSEYISGSKYASILNMKQLHRVLNISQYSYICLNLR